MQITKEDVMAKLKSIPDPELGISIVDLGLIYDANVDQKNNVTVVMTLTTIGCPLFSLIAEPIKTTVRELPGVNDVFVELTFDPPWSPEKMSEEAKVTLGFA